MAKEDMTPSLRLTCPPCGEVFAAQSEQMLIDMAVEHARKFHDLNLLDKFSNDELRLLVKRENESYWSRIAHLIPNGRLRTVLQENLCHREREIVSYVVHGFANREIANRLFISQRTVSTHLVNIYEKLNVHSRAELTALVRASDRIIEAALRAGTEPEFGPFVQTDRPRRGSRSRSAERA
jgi:ATP/maltotriose-dependent transcriptional regulator MalT